MDKALSLNPNHSRALYVRGSNEIFAGDPVAAIPFIERCMRIDPKADRHHLQFLGLAHFLLGNYETAATIFRERIILSPQTDVGRVMLAATLGQLGETDTARHIWHELMEINPKYSLGEHLLRLFSDPAEQDHHGGPRQGRSAQLTRSAFGARAGDMARPGVTEEPARLCRNTTRSPSAPHQGIWCGGTEGSQPVGQHDTNP